MKVLNNKLVTNKISVEDLLKESLINFSIKTGNKQMFNELAKNEYLLIKEREIKKPHKAMKVTPSIWKPNGDYVGFGSCDNCEELFDLFSHNQYHFCEYCWIERGCVE